ncbi:MAG: LamG-like jellyroll fold domain-containing protein, partial [Ekhidna sp.]
MKKSVALLLNFLLVTALLVNDAKAQSCSENTNVNGIAGTGFSNGTIGQSFTACSDGKLASVSVQAGNASSGFNNVIVQIFSGDGFGGSVLGTTGQVNVRANRTTTFSLSSLNILVVEGQKYTARFLTQSGTPMMAYGTGANTAIDYYSRGRIHGAAQSHNDMFFSAVIETLSAPVKSPEDDALAVTRDTEVKLSFSRDMEAVSGDITIENITDATTQTVDVTTLTIDGRDVLMPLSTPLEGGKDYEIIIPANSLQSTNDIPFAGVAAGEWTFSTSTKPFATLATTSADLTNDAVIPFSIDFSDVVTGFDLTDFAITNGVASNLAGSDDAFTFDVTPSADGDVVVSLPPNVVEAGASNGNDSTGYALVYDGTVPTVLLRTDESGAVESSVFDIEVVFSEPVSGFESSDLVITNAEIVSSASTLDSLFTISLRALAQGQITVDLPADIADDLAGNANTAAPAIIDVTFTVDLDSDVISYYPFDGNANDSVSTGFNGTVTGATLTTGFDGTADGAYNFDGGDQITFGDTPIGAGSYSIGFWVKIPEGLGAESRIILEKRPVCSEGRFFSIIYRNHATRGNEIVVSQRNNGGATAPIVSGLTVGEWMHVTYVKDNDNSSSSLYINGVQESEVAWGAAYNFENSANLIAGSGPCVGADGTIRFIGDLDEMHIYGRALTAVEIDLLVPFALKNASVASGGDIQAGDAVELNFNKNVSSSSVNSTNITTTASVSGSITANITTENNQIVISPPATGWPKDEDITISISGLLAENGTTLPATDLTYSVIEEEALGLILHYPISGNANEAIGEIAGQNGTISGALFVEGVDGDPFGALSFDGTDDVVTLGDAPISSESFSMSMWLKVPADGSTTQNSVILSKRDACSEGRMINIWYLRSGDKFRVVGGLRDNASAGSVSTGFNFPVEEWVNVTFTKDNATKQYRLIVNGVLEAESAWTLNSVNVENNTAIKLGTSPCVGNGEVRFDGQIDDLRIYDRVIDARVVSIEPVRGTANAATDTVVTIKFDRVLDTSSLDASTVSITDLDEVSYSYTTAFSNGDSVLTITPDNDLPRGKEIIVTIDTLSALIGSDFLPFQTSFTTISSQLLSYSPSNGASNVDSVQTIAFKFDNEMNMSSLESGIKIVGSQHGTVEGDFTMPETDSVVFTPSTPYFPNEMITVYVTSDLQDAGGESISNTRVFKFHAESGIFTNPTLSFELTKLTTSGTTPSPRALVPVDMDGDGDLDLVGGDDGSRRLLFFENLGSGNFGTATSIAAGRGYFDVKVTDFDLDGDMDVVSVDRSVSQGLYWYENDGAGNFTEDLIVALTNTDTRSIAIADYNKDGMMDVAVASFGSNRFTVYQQDGTSLFAAANASQPIFLSEADWNGDGNMDIIAGNYGGSVVRWTNSGIGTFSGSGIHSAAQIRSVIPFDIDQDGDMDVVYSSQSGNQIGVLQNDGIGSFTNVQVGSVLGPHRLDVGDVDGDGDFDIVYTTAGTGSDINFHYLENSGSLTLWTSQRLMPNETFSGGFTQTANFADLDNDGDLDVAATDAEGGFYVFENMIIDLNAAPIVTSPVADQTLAEDDSEGLVIDVSTVFTDSEGDTFTITATSDNDAVTAVVNGTNLEIDIATANFFGVVNITLTADDGNATNNDSFILTVTSVNDEPAFDLSAATITVDEDFTTTETITVTQNQPIDEDAPTYSITPSTSSLATVAIDQATGEVTVVAIADAFGTEEFTITANDGGAENNTATQTLTLIVNGINDAPVLSTAIADVSFDEDPTVNGGVNLNNSFTDADGEDLTFTLDITSGDDLAELSLNEGTISIIPEP